MRSIKVFIILFWSCSSLAQKGIEAGLQFGVPLINEELNSGRKYMPFQLIGTWTFAQWNKRNRNAWSFYLEPQFVWVHFNPKSKTEAEFGVNLGIAHHLRLSDKTQLKSSIGTGPHYITAETGQQARGFIFSDNFSSGIVSKLNSKTDLTLSARFRHISNANLQQPNKGIDSWFLILGLTHRFHKL